MLREWLLELQLPDLQLPELLLLELWLLQLELRMPQGLAVVAQQQYSWLLLRWRMMVRADLSEVLGLWVACPSPPGNWKSKKQMQVKKNITSKWPHTESFI